jgi:hypothetical protein
MNRIMIWPVAISLAAVGMTGCNSGKTAAQGSGYVPQKAQNLDSAMLPPGSEADYFPFNAGSQWTFEAEASQMVNGTTSKPSKQEITYRLAQVKTIPGGGKDAYFDILDGEKVVDKQIWRIDKKGIYQVALNLKLDRFSTPQLMVPFPATKGATFKWRGSVSSGKSGTQNATNAGTVVGPEPIDTAMGSFNALAVETKGTMSSARAKSEIASRIWFVPKVGIGRYRQEISGEATDANPKANGRKFRFVAVQVMKLKNYSLKK